jgi:tRNA(fMet)-specific endonuclease VapC
MICLDTNVVIALLNKSSLPIRMRVKEALESRISVAVSPIVIFELQYGAGRSGQRKSNLQKINDFLSGPVQVLNFDLEDAQEAADIRMALRRLGTPIGPYDVLIAGQARRRGAVLVTANENEFRRVPGLKTENWEPI